MSANAAADSTQPAAISRVARLARYMTPAGSRDSSDATP
jgi:hypothetical protein